MATYYVGKLEEFSEYERRVVSVDDAEIVVFAHEGRIHALSNVCRHMGGPVGEGRIIGKVVPIVDDEGRYLSDNFSAEEIQLVCPWHGWAYDIETGQFAGHEKICLPRYETEVRGEEVYLHV